MADLYNITTPFGLLDAETQAALKAHRGKIEYYGCDGSWIFIPSPAWLKYSVYRAKKKPLEFWVNEYKNCAFGLAYSTKEKADHAGGASRTRCIHVREVEEK